MIPRDVTEFFDRLERATDAFWVALGEVAYKAGEDVATGLDVLFEDMGDLLANALDLDLEEEELSPARYEHVWTEESFSYESDRPFTQLYFYVGDSTCRFNALNADLRCAVNPYGPCRCEHYEPREDFGNSFGYAEP